MKITKHFLKNQIIIIIIFFITITSFYSNFVYNNITNTVQDGEKELNDLSRRSEALASSYDEIVSNELSQLSRISEYQFQASLLIEQVHIRLKMNLTNQDFYSNAQYISDLSKISDYLVKANLETLDTTAFILYAKFYLDNFSFYNVNTRGFTYNITKNDWIKAEWDVKPENSTNPNPIIIPLNVSILLLNLYNNWNTTIQDQIYSMYSQKIGTIPTYSFYHISNSVVFYYNNLYAFYEAIRVDYYNQANLISNKTNEINQQKSLVNQISNIVSIFTVSTILATFIATRTENRENDRKLDELKHAINEDSGEIKKANDYLGLMILFIALIISIVGFSLILYLDNLNTLRAFLNI